MHALHRSLVLAAALLVALLAPVVSASADHGEDGAGTVLTPPEIFGVAVAGDTLVAQPGTWTTAEDATVVGYLYQWMRCDASGANCAAIPDAIASSYGLGAGDVGTTLRVEVTQVSSQDPEDNEGRREGDDTVYSQPGTSAATAVVAAPVVVIPPAPPLSSAAPLIQVQHAPQGSDAVISGVSAVGNLLIASTGSWSGTAPITFTYQWLRCSPAGTDCTPIPGATGREYRLTSQDVGHTMRVVVTAHNAAGASQARSVQTRKVVLVPVLHRSELVHVLGGVVLVRAPGDEAFQALGSTALVPDGSTVDTSGGAAALTVAADGHGHVWHASVHGASFVVHQLKGRRPLTRLRLVDSGLVCPVADPARATSRGGSPLATVAGHRPRHHRTLWAHDSGGSFTTQGQYASAIVRGTTWETTDTCEGTVFRVIAGSIIVHDRTRHRTVLVRAGHSYEVWAPDPKGTRQDV